ncbi:MAG: hypothetical protein KDA65_09970 [Planctomycetaceae bacterium]|nr:hypothetical protein [Planctomycetaceae bacterium]
MFYLDNLAFDATKLVKRGEAEMNPLLEELADWIESKYGNRPLNIVMTSHYGTNRVCVKIIFEFEKERRSLLSSDHFLSSTHRNKSTAILKQLHKILSYNVDKKLFPKILCGPKRFKIFRPDIVYDFYLKFEAFAPAFISETCQNLPQSAFDELVKQFNSDPLWTIARLGSWVTFFVFTEEQKVECLKKKREREWNASIYSLVKRHDEFGYIKKNTFSVSVESKEVFDTKYKGSWFYFFR